MITCLQCRGVQAPGFHLGVDFGTSHTVAVLRWPDGRTKPLLFDGSPLLPSAVYVDDTGQLVVGRDALDSARLNPGRLEPNPKRRIDEETVLLGPAELPVGDLIAAVLSRVAAESLRVAGELPAVVTITCPIAPPPVSLVVTPTAYSYSGGAACSAAVSQFVVTGGTAPYTMVYSGTTSPPPSIAQNGNQFTVTGLASAPLPRIEPFTVRDAAGAAQQSRTVSITCNP